MSDTPPTPDEVRSDAEQYRLLQAKRIIVACERLGYGDPRDLGSEQTERVEGEIAANRDAIDETVAQRWPETFGGLGVIPARVDLTLDRRSRAGDRQALVAREDLDQLELAGRHGGE